MKTAFLLTALLLFMGCSSPDPAPPSKTRDLRLCIQSEPLSLDPRIGGDADSQQIIRMLFEGLTRIGPDHRPHLGLAKKIDISDDHTVYIFHLRQASWSNREPVTAYDFEHAWKTALTPGYDASCAHAFYPIRNAKKAKKGEVPIGDIGISAIDPFTLMVELEHPAPYFLELLANPIYSPVHHTTDLIRDQWSQSPQYFLCNGPFQLVAWDRQQIILKRNPYYWDHDAVALPGLHVSIIGDAHEMLELYETSQLDWAGKPLLELPVDALPRLRRAGKLLTQEICQVYQYTFNTTHPPFCNAKIRQAFAYAINRQALIENVLQGGEVPAYSILPLQLTLQDTPLFTDGNLRLAQTRLQQGLRELHMTKEQIGPITLNYSIHEGSTALAQAVAHQWEEAFGIPVRLEGNPWAAHYAKYCNHDFQIGSLSWFSWVSDPFENLEQVKYGDDQVNGSAWEHPDYIQLLDISNHATDPQKRRSLLRTAEELVMQEMPIAPLYTNTFKYLQQENVHGIYLSPLGQIDFKWAWLEND